MSGQTIITAAGQPAATLEAVLVGIREDQHLTCRFEESIGKWSCTVWGDAARWEADLYGIGTTLAAALADLHPPEFLKRARDAGLQEWATEDEPE